MDWTRLVKHCSGNTLHPHTREIKEILIEWVPSLLPFFPLFEDISSEVYEIFE